MFRSLCLFIMLLVKSQFGLAAKSGLLICPDRFGLDSFVQAEKERWTDFGLEVVIVDFYGEKAQYKDPEALQKWSQLSPEKIQNSIKITILN